MVTLINVNDDRDILVCDVIIYYTGPRQIVCNTRWVPTSILLPSIIVDIGNSTC